MRTSIEYHGSPVLPVRLLLLALLPALTATARAHPGAQPGEAFTFKLSVDRIESGRARMSVGIPVEKSGRRLLAVHGQAETLPWLALVLRLKNDYRVVLDADTLLPSEIVSIEEGGRARRIEATLDGRTVNLSLTSKRESGQARRPLTGVTYDPLTALFAARAAPLADGDALVLVILDGTRLWRSRIAVRRAPLRLEHDERARPTIRLEGVNQQLDERGHPTLLPPRHYTVWLSDDRDRVLLRMVADVDLGHGELELTSYQRGHGQAAPPRL